MQTNPILHTTVEFHQFESFTYYCRALGCTENLKIVINGSILIMKYAVERLRQKLTLLEITIYKKKCCKKSRMGCLKMA